MMRQHSTDSIIITILSLLFCAVTAEATQAPFTSSPLQLPVSVNADSGSWRREPFIGSMKKIEVPLGIRNIRMKPVAGVPKLEQEHTQEIQLQGIMQADKRVHALINGRNVKAGDTIGGLTIKHISRYQVVVVNERKEKIVYDIYQGRLDRGIK